jgi:hypothetical protein
MSGFLVAVNSIWKLKRQNKALSFRHAAQSVQQNPHGDVVVLVIVQDAPAKTIILGLYPPMTPFYGSDP